MNAAFFTICCANYLPRALVLFQSLAEHAPSASLRLVLAEDPAARPAMALPPSVRLLGVEDLGIPRVEHMAFGYDITEFNTALKPYAFLRLFEAGHDAVFYLDPDIRFYSSAAPLLDHLDQGDLLLTPHIAKPYACDGLFPTVRDCLHVGQFNLGFAAMRPTPQTLDFTRWWAERLREHCLMDPGGYNFVDQLWASHAPSFVDRVKVLRQSCYNMAYWNLFQRSLTREGDAWMTEDGPLCFFHFSGHQFHRPEVLSRYSPRNSPVPPGSDLERLLADYSRETRAMAQVFPFEELPYSYAAWRDGAPVTPVQRRRFLALPREERLAVADPFAPEHRARLERGRYDGSEPWRFLLLGRLERLQSVARVLAPRRLHEELADQLTLTPGEPADQPGAPPALRLALALERLEAWGTADSRLWQKIGGLLATTNLTDLALKAFARAQACDPDNLDLHLFISDALRYAGRHEEALDALDRSPDPAWPGLAFKRGQVLCALGRLEEAREALAAEAPGSRWSAPAGEWLEKLG